jgi:hypothetical protein
MKEDDLDRILSGEGPMAPSSGFVASVMVAVRRENVTPACLSFPWKWALPGIAAALTSVVLLCADIARSLAAPTVSGHVALMFSGWNSGTTVWTVVAAMVSAAAITLGTAVSFDRASQ